MLNLTLATCRHYKKVLRFNRLVTSTSKIHHPCVGPFYYLNAMIDPTPGKPPSSVMEFHTLQIYIRVMVFCCPMLLGTTVPMIHFKPMILWRKPFWASDFMGKGNEMGREGKGKEREGNSISFLSEWFYGENLAYPKPHLQLWLGKCRTRIKFPTFLRWVLPLPLSYVFTMGSSPGSWMLHLTSVGNFMSSPHS